MVLHTTSTDDDLVAVLSNFVGTFAALLFAALLCALAAATASVGVTAGFDFGGFCEELARVQCNFQCHTNTLVQLGQRYQWSHM